MSGDDWQAGDDALCVNDEPSRSDLRHLGRVLRRGAIYRVQRAKWSCDPTWGPNYGLYLKGVPSSPNGWDASRFRKINPLTDEERDEFLADLNVPVREVRHG